MMVLYISGSCAFAVFCATLLNVGYSIGVRETEKRWSDTVSKADWICRYGDPSTLDGRRFTDAGTKRSVP